MDGWMDSWIGRRTAACMVLILVVFKWLAMVGMKAKFMTFHFHISIKQQQQPSSSKRSRAYHQSKPRKCKHFIGKKIFMMTNFCFFFYFFLIFLWFLSYKTMNNELFLWSNFTRAPPEHHFAASTMFTSWHGFSPAFLFKATTSWQWFMAHYNGNEFFFIFCFIYQHTN